MDHEGLQPDLDPILPYPDTSTLDLIDATSDNLECVEYCRDIKSANKYWGKVEVLLTKFPTSHQNSGVNSQRKEHIQGYLKTIWRGYQFEDTRISHRSHTNELSHLGLRRLLLEIQKVVSIQNLFCQLEIKLIDSRHREAVLLSLLNSFQNKMLSENKI